MFDTAFLEKKEEILDYGAGDGSEWLLTSANAFETRCYPRGIY